MLIDAQVHERFVREFGINMLNTLQSKEHRLTAHRRRIFVFDERGGVFGGEGEHILEYQNLTTGVFYSRRRQVVGVRYRCRPNDLEVPDMGGFHTHPALYDQSVRTVRRRIDRMLWLSDMDVKAFLKQHELYGYRWHFVGTVDIGCFHIDDVLRDKREPREIVRYADLAGLLDRLAPHIHQYDKLLTNQATARRTPSADLLEQLIRTFTAQSANMWTVIATHPEHEIPGLARMVAHELQMLGYTFPQVSHLAKRTFTGGDAPIGAFKDHLLSAYTRLSALSS